MTNRQSISSFEVMDVMLEPLCSIQLGWSIVNIIWIFNRTLPISNPLQR